MRQIGIPRLENAAPDPRQCTHEAGQPAATTTTALPSAPVQQALQAWQREGGRLATAGHRAAAYVPPRQCQRDAGGLQGAAAKRQHGFIKQHLWGLFLTSVSIPATPNLPKVPCANSPEAYLNWGGVCIAQRLARLEQRARQAQVFKALRWQDGSKSSGGGVCMVLLATNHGLCGCCPATNRLAMHAELRTRP